MQDKDFDRFFKDQFEEAEITPSTNLWANIEQGLAPKRKTVLPVYWMAAAVVFIAVSVGLLMPDTETIKLQGTATEDMASINAAPALAAPAVQAGQGTMQKDVDASIGTPLVIAPRLTAADVKKDFAVMQPNVTKIHPDDMELAPGTVIDDTMAQIEEKIRDNEAMIASLDAQHETSMIAAAAQPEQKGIRNVGDLVNMVVGKVDKREKKFIQFNTDEDDNSSLIAINIGFLKFNKRDK